MFSVPRSFVAPPAWKIIGLWVGISVLSILVSPWINQLIFAIFSLEDSSYISARFSIPIIFGSVMHFWLEWLVLRRYFAGMRWWVAIHFGVSLIATLLNDLLERLSFLFIAITDNSLTMIKTYSFLAGAIINLLWALVFGLAGWRIFRASVSGAGRWILARIGSHIIRSGLTFWFILPLLIEYKPRAISLRVSFLNLAIVLVASLIEAFVLVRFLAKRRKTASG